MKPSHRLAILLLLFSFIVASWALAAGPPPGGDSGDEEPYYNPYGNNPPGPPPNYNLVDSSYFQGVPVMPGPLENNVGGYYIYNDTTEGKWYIANHLFTRGVLSGAVPRFDSGPDGSGTGPECEFLVARF